MNQAQPTTNTVQQEQQKSDSDSSESINEVAVKSEETPSTELVLEKEKSLARNRITAQKELEDAFTPFRYVYPEFLPDPNLKYRNKIKEKLERLDMLHRRSHVDIPEFYVGKW